MTAAGEDRIEWLDGNNEKKECTHMKIYAQKIPNRKDLVKRIEELTRKKALYTFVPRCAYEIGEFSVEKDGCLTTTNDADEMIIDILTQEGMIGALINEDETTVDVIPEISVTAEATEEWGDDDDQIEDNRTDSDEPPSEMPGIEHESIPGNDANECLHSELDSDGFEPDELLNTRISFSLNAHTVQSLTNLVCMIYSRGALLSKATGGTFFADKGLVDSILDENVFRSVNELISYITEWGEIKTPLMGISFDHDNLTFDGFGQNADADHVQTYMKLAAAMNKMAIMQKRVQARDVDDSNEKYSLRVWLIRLGLNGTDCKADRKRLLENLSGHSAFRNDAERERWETKQQAKRDAQKFEPTEEENNDAVSE